MGDRVRERAELAAQTMATLCTMRAGLDRSASDGFDMLPAIDRTPRQEQTPAIEHGPDERDRQRQRDRGHDGPDMGGIGR